MLDALIESKVISKSKAMNSDGEMSNNYSSTDPRDAAAASKTTRWWIAAGLILTGALLCLAAGIGLPYIAGCVLSGKLKLLLPISPESVAYKSWVSSELRFQVWLWNVTNSWAVQNEGATPHLEQVGPFTFAENRTRASIEFFDNNTVSYDDVRAYYFLEDESVGDMRNYVITNVNLPYLTIALRLKEQSVFLRNMVHDYFSKSRAGILSNRTVHELLVGYTDSAIEQVRAMLIITGQKLPKQFGLLVGKNNTAKGTALVGTGSNNLTDLSRLHRWNGESELHVWPKDFGNQLVGSSDGSMFPPPVTPESSLRVFTPDLCRSAGLTFVGHNRVRDIPVLRFRVAKTAMMRADDNPENAAFCTPRCLDSGVLNVSLCLPGIPPVVASAPHFYGAPAYSAAVRMRPDKRTGQAELDTRLEVEPNTGLMLRAARRMQINVALESVKGFPDTKPFGSLLLMPYAWLNESGSIGPEAAARFRSRVLGPMRLASLVSWLLLAAGLALLILGCVVCSLGIRLQAIQQLGQSRRRQQTQLRTEAKLELEGNLYFDSPSMKRRQSEEKSPSADEPNAEDDPAEPKERLLPAQLKSLPETDIV